MPDFSKIPPIIGLSLAVLMALSFWSGTKFGYEQSDKGIRFGFFYQENKPLEVLQYYGYYKDTAGPNSKVVVSREDVKLSEYENDRVEAFAEGDVVTADGQMVHKTWKLLGFKQDGVFMLSYRTVKGGKSDTEKNVGTYVLTKDRSFYSGKWFGTDNSHGTYLKCPYVLSTIQMKESDALEKYRDILEQECVVYENDQNPFQINDVAAKSAESQILGRDSAKSQSRAGR